MQRDRTRQRCEQRSLRWGRGSLERALKVMVGGGVEPALTAGLSPPCPGATASEAFLEGPAVGLVQSLSPLACPTETGFRSQSPCPRV